MKKKSVLLMAVAVMLVAAMSIGGMLAYFTDEDSKTNTFTVGKVDITLTEPQWDAEGYDENIPTLIPSVTYVKDPTITVEEGSQDSYVFLTLKMNKYVSLLNLMGVDAALDSEIPSYTKHESLGSFVTALAQNDALRQAVVDKWFKGIDHSQWKVMNVDEITAAIGGAATGENPKAFEVVLGYIGSEDDLMSAGDSVTFMTGFGIPASVTQSMMDGEDAYIVGDHSASNFNTDAAKFKMTFTASAIQATGFETIDAAYAELFK